MKSPDNADDTGQVVNILYRNWKGYTAVRRIIPHQIRFEATEWHPNVQWILFAYDIDRQAERAFACLDILAWFVQ